MYARSSRGLTRRRAVVGVMTAIALTALLGMVALSLDLGSVVLGSQRAQYVADMAALAAAQQVPATGNSAALAAVSSTVAGNNPPSGPQITWQSSETHFYAAGATVPKYGTLTSAQSAVQVITHLPVNFSFARAVGLTGTTVTRKATALRTVGTLPCVLAAGKSGSSLQGVAWSGSSITVNGSVWSNGDVIISGSSNTINGNMHADNNLTVSGSTNTVSGTAAWVKGCSISGSDPNMVPTKVASGAEAYPITYSTGSSFGTYTYDVPSYSLSSSNGAVPPGIYYVTGNVSISGSNNSLAGVTFVAGGTISISGSNDGPLSPAAANGCSFYSLSTQSNAISISGSGGTWSGIIYAPNGGIAFTGSSGTVLNASLMAQTISISGSSWTIGGMANPSGVQVSLIG